MNLILATYPTSTRTLLFEFEVLGLKLLLINSSKTFSMIRAKLSSPELNLKNDYVLSFIEKT